MEKGIRNLLCVFTAD